MSIANFWNTTDEKVWKEKMKKYWELVKPQNITLEEEMGSIDAQNIQLMSTLDFYQFLFEKYFYWKYTAKNRLATTRKYLRKYVELEKMNELRKIQEEIFTFDLIDAHSGIKIATQIRGLGSAGASGLLAILFPEHFGVVDQFVVKALCTVNDLNLRNSVSKINPDSIKPFEAALLINILRVKAKELNVANNTTYWTPRMIDMILWANR